MKRIGIVYHEDFKKYDFGPGHPLRGEECMDRSSAFDLLENHELLKNLTDVRFYEPVGASEEEVLSVHTKEYVEFVTRLNEAGGIISMDTPAFKGMYSVAKLFTGAAILAEKLVIEGEVGKSFAFTMMGHHVGADFGGGFGAINDVAISIHHLRRHYGLNRILVVDYAANAGHGTERIFYDTSEVLCIDIHQDPLNLYPGKGFPEQVGRGEGKGYTVNVSLPPYSVDEHYIRALNEIVLPIAYEYRPEIVIAVGLNGCHFTVQINQLMLTLHGLKETVRALSTISNDTCRGRFVNIGGFSLDRKLSGPGFLATVAGALDIEIDLNEPYEMPETIPDVSEDVTEAIESVRDIQRKYWRCLQ